MTRATAAPAPASQHPARPPAARTGARRPAPGRHLAARQARLIRGRRTVPQTRARKRIRRSTTSSPARRKAGPGNPAAATPSAPAAGSWRPSASRSPRDWPATWPPSPRPRPGEHPRRTEIYTGAGTGERTGHQDFTARVAERAGLDEPHAAYILRVVTEVAGETVERGLMAKATESLPAGIRQFVTAGSTG
jgi:Uncharacterized conserved protein (DUF2267)